MNMSFINKFTTKKLSELKNFKTFYSPQWNYRNDPNPLVVRSDIPGAYASSSL